MALRFDSGGTWGNRKDGLQDGIFRLVAVREMEEALYKNDRESWREVLIKTADRKITLLCNLQDRGIE